MLIIVKDIPILTQKMIELYLKQCFLEISIIRKRIIVVPWPFSFR